MNILLGVSGSIAAYKSCQLVRLLQKQGHHVRVILSPNATKFVTALSFEALTQQKVYQDMFGGNSFATEHIEIARWADLFLIAPASAQTIFGLAHGQADSLLLTVALAFEGPMMIAPAMNTKMWFAPALQSNLQLLKNRNVQVIEPRDGELACKEMGTGAMAEPDEILETVGAHFGKSRLKDKKIVITAGATREYLDPVRFLSNPSTGAMGIALAKRAHERGAEVILVHGPTQLSIPERISSVSVTSAQQMYDYVMSQTPSDVFISSAAVADYRAEKIHYEKIKKSDQDLELRLVRNPDIVSEVSQKKRPQDVVIGFAAQSSDLEHHAKNKMEKKQLDMIVGNLVHQEQKGFGNVHNDFYLLTKSNHQWCKNMGKDQVAKAILDEIENLIEAKLHS